MFKLTFCFVFVLSIYASAESETPSAAMTFEKEVYPHLFKRCSHCHAFEQNPMHSQFSAEDSYGPALTTINLNFPEESALWKRSFNNHCGKPQRCGEKDDRFREAIFSWIEAEKKEKSVDSGFVKVATAEAEDTGDGKKTLKFTFENKTVLRIDLENMDDETLLLNNLSFEKLTSSLAFEGLEVRSPTIDFAYQNFDEQAWVFKKSEEPAKFTDLSAIESSYLIGQNVESHSPTIVFELWLKEPLFGQSNLELNELVTAGYYSSIDQAVFSELVSFQGIYEGSYDRDRHCASFKTGELDCWTAQGTVHTLFKLPARENGIVQLKTWWSSKTQKRFMLLVTAAGHVYHSIQNKDFDYPMIDGQKFPIEDVKEIIILKDSPCLSTADGRLHCLTPRALENLFAGNLVSSDVNNFITTDLFIKDPIKAVLKGPAMSYDEYYSVIVFESGRIKFVDQALLETMDEKAIQGIVEAPDFEFPGNERPKMVRQFGADRDIFMIGMSGLTFLFEDSFLTFYFRRYDLPSGIQPQQETIEDTLQRLKVTPRLRFPNEENPLNI